MRASHIALILAVLAVPSVGYAQQDNGPVGGPAGGMVGPEGSSSPEQAGPSSPEQPRPSLGSPYGSPTRGAGDRARSSAIAPGQVGWRRVVVDGVPQNVRVTPRADGIGSAFINGQRVLVDLNTNRVLQQGNGAVGGSVGGSVGGPVGGLVGPGGSSSLGQPRPSRGSPYVSRRLARGLHGLHHWPARSFREMCPSWDNTPERAPPIINGQRVLVDTNTNRVLRPY
jgi:hypothetical protein